MKLKSGNADGVFFQRENSARKLLPVDKSARETRTILARLSENARLCCCGCLTYQQLTAYRPRIRVGGLNDIVVNIPEIILSLQRLPFLSVNPEFGLKTKSIEDYSLSDASLFFLPRIFLSDLDM